MNVNKLISLKTLFSSWCLREMYVSLQQQLGRLFHKVKFPKCKVHKYSSRSKTMIKHVKKMEKT